MSLRSEPPIDDGVDTIGADHEPDWAEGEYRGAAVVAAVLVLALLCSAGLAVTGLVWLVRVVG